MLMLSPSRRKEKLTPSLSRKERPRPRLTLKRLPKPKLTLPLPRLRQMPSKKLMKRQPD